MKTAHVKNALRLHYPVREYALMFEVADATGTRKTRSADAVVMNLWPSRGLLVEGIEIKVSRADWRRELAQPEKAEAVAKYCDKWWIVAPKGIVQEHEIPAMWGYKEVSDAGGIRVIKQAPDKDPVPLTRDFVAAMLRRASEADAAEVESAVKNSMDIHLARFEERVDREVRSRTTKFNDIIDKIDILKELGLDIEGVDPQRYNTYREDVKSFAEKLEIGRLVKNNIKLLYLENSVTNLEETSHQLGELAKLLKGTTNVK